MSPSALIEFLRLGTEERLRLVATRKYRRELITYMGEVKYQEYLHTAVLTVEALAKRHLAVVPAANLIFVPGVMGSLLHSETYGGVWWIDARTRSHINDLKLAPDGTTDAHPAHQIKPFTIDTLYEPFLAAILRTKDFRHTIFPYDWRKRLLDTAPMLRARILELYAANKNREIHLVAHSMGGLVVRATLMIYGAELWDKIGRIVFIGTPHYGSPAVASYLKHHLWGFELLELLGRLYLSRETFRSLWGVLSMLPAPTGIYPGTRRQENANFHPCTNFDFYQAAAWKLDLSTPEDPLGLKSHNNLQKILNSANRLHQDLYKAHWALRVAQRHRMAVIAGVGIKTLYRLEYRKRGFRIWSDVKCITDTINGNPHREGDGRVPLASAELEDIGSIRYVRGIHASLPMMSGVYEDVFSWLRGEEMQLPTSPTDALFVHLGRFSDVGESKQSIINAQYPWKSPSLSDEQVVELEGKLNSGSLSEFITTRLF